MREEFIRQEMLFGQAAMERLEKEGYPISFAEDIPAWVASAPDTALYGARPLRNFIHRNIEIPLSVALLTGDLPSDGIITRQMLNEKLTIGN